MSDGEGLLGVFPSAAKTSAFHVKDDYFCSRCIIVLTSAGRIFE
jgi:hypothetical protein